jgi:hypothetical protein
MGSIPKGYAIQKVKKERGVRHFYVRESLLSKLIYFVVFLTDKLTGYKEDAAGFADEPAAVSPSPRRAESESSSRTRIGHRRFVEG